MSSRLLRIVELAMPEIRKHTPCQTMSDFIRWALQDGVKEFLGDLNNKKLTAMYQHYEAHQTVLKEEKAHRDTLEILDSTRKEVATLESLRAYEEIPRFLRRVEVNIRNMEPNFWTNRIKDEFYREYGVTLKRDRISPRPRDAQKDEGEGDE